MLQLDHMTKGRVMMGWGPRPWWVTPTCLELTRRSSGDGMDEALGIILRLWTETEPITYESDWFTLKEARVHLRPYSQTAHANRGSGRSVASGND